MQLSNLPIVCTLLAGLSLSPLYGAWELAYQTQATPIPGEEVSLQGATPTLIDGALYIKGYILENNVTRYYLLRYADGQLTTTVDPADGYPGSGGVGNILNYPDVKDNKLLFSLYNTDPTRDGVIASADNMGNVTVAIPSAQSFLGEGSRHYGFPSASTGTAYAMTGFDAGFAHFILRYDGSDVSVLAQESVTALPGTSNTVSRFGNFTYISPNGANVAFIAQSTGSAPDQREGIYLHDGTEIKVIMDNTTLYPGTDKTFYNLWGQHPGYFGPDGAFYSIRGTAGDISSTDYIGIMRYMPGGNLTALVQNGDVIDGVTVDKILGFKFTTDGTVIFNDDANNFFSWKDGDFHFIATYSEELPILSREAWFIMENVLVVQTHKAGVTTLYMLDPLDDAIEPLYTFDENHPLGADARLEYFDTKGEMILMGDYTRFVVGGYGDLMKLHPWIGYFGEPDEQVDDYYRNADYDWFYSKAEQWPWVYSFTAQRWLYCFGAIAYPFTSYVPGIGWIFSHPSYWPWYYDYGTNTWAQF